MQTTLLRTDQIHYVMLSIARDWLSSNPEIKTTLSEARPESGHHFDIYISSLTFINESLITK